MTKKTIVISGAAATLGLAALIGIGSAGAASTPGSLAGRIASAFHLNSAEVQKVIDQNRADNQAAMQQKQQTRLDQAVKDGKITSAQEKLILDKLAALKSQRDSSTGKTPEERRAAMEQNRTDLENWAKANNIPLEYLHPVHGFGHGPGSDGTSS